jgi:hypothetical protein
MNLCVDLDSFAFLINLLSVSVIVGRKCFRYGYYYVFYISICVIVSVMDPSLFGLDLDQLFSNILIRIQS